MNILLSSKKTKELKKNQINEICKLKNTHWRYSFKSSLEWFKDYVKKNDIHNLIYSNSKLIGYTLLRIRTLFLEKKKKKYLYFDTFIIKKKYRKKNISNYLMKLNNKVIKKNKKISFLICKKEMINYYKKFGWSKMNRKIFLIKDQKFNKSGMCFNCVINSKKKYRFYLYK